jgi:hypothetical protein
MKGSLEKLLGPSWRTTLAGLVSGICAFISFYPESIEPLPDYWESLVRQILAFLIGAGLIQMGRKSRDAAESENSVKVLEEKIEKVKYEKF